MIKWIRISRLSIKKSLSYRGRAGRRDRAGGTFAALTSEIQRARVCEEYGERESVSGRYSKRERERETERVCKGDTARECVRERERERERESVCVSQIPRERESVRECERKSVCERVTVAMQEDAIVRAGRSRY